MRTCICPSCGATTPIGFDGRIIYHTVPCPATGEAPPTARAGGEASAVKAPQSPVDAPEPPEAPTPGHAQGAPQEGGERDELREDRDSWRTRALAWRSMADVAIWTGTCETDDMALDATRAALFERDEARAELLTLRAELEALRAERVAGRVRARGDDCDGPDDPPAPADCDDNNENEVNHA